MLMILLVAGFIVLIFDSLSILPHRRKAQGCGGMEGLQGLIDEFNTLCCSSGVGVRKPTISKEIS